MLFCTSLIAYVGAGEQPALTPRKLTVWNTSTQRPIQDLSFPTSVLAVYLNRQR
jgi:autophagy-related protein 18